MLPGPVRSGIVQARQTSFQDFGTPGRPGAKIAIAECYAMEAVRSRLERAVWL